MRVVADLDEDYIAKMDDVSATSEQPYNPQETVAGKPGPGMAA